MWNSFCATLKIKILTKLMVLLAGTMIFELAVKNDTESTYLFLLSEKYLLILKIIKNTTTIDVLKAPTMILKSESKRVPEKWIRF